MPLDRWLQNLRSALTLRPAQRHGRRRGPLRAATYRLRIESLEDRRLLTFSPAVTYAAGVSPTAVVTADFNNDGHLDLATANLYDNTVSALLGNADGTFQTAQTSATGALPISLAAGDFNGDGHLDLATANYDGGDVSILLGNGDGTFAAPIDQYTSGAVPWSIATGDLNADGKPDLVVASGEYGGYVSVLLGHGDGTFAVAAYGPYGIYIFSPVLADFNGDGKIDVAVASNSTDSVKVFLGNGDGTLREPSDFATGQYPNSVTAGDFNADGKLDLATAHSKSVRMLLGNGDGTFQTAQSFPGVGAPTASDVNGDGKLDLVGVANTSSPEGAVGVLLGNGDGSLAEPITTATGGSSTSSVVVADFNGDGRPDAAAANEGSNNVSVLLNDGNWPSSDVPSLSISDATVTEGNTGTVHATFTVALSSASAVDVTVHYDTADLSAAAGSDYTAASGDVTIPVGQTSATFTVAVRGDRLGEPNETFLVNLSSPTNAAIADGQGAGAIVDDEPRVSISDVTKSEGKRGKTTYFTFTVTLSAAYDEAVTMSFTTANGTATTGDFDYVAKSGTLTFKPGETTKTITIAVKGDSKREADETFYLDLFGLSSNALFTKNRGLGTILNDDR